MGHSEAWQIAGQICDMLLDTGDIDTTARQHEKMADIIHKHADQRWDAHDQCWRDSNDRPITDAGITAHVIVQGTPANE